jgi:hypothetical protein
MMLFTLAVKINMNNYPGSEMKHRLDDDVNKITHIQIVLQIGKPSGFFGYSFLMNYMSAAG